MYSFYKFELYGNILQKNQELCSKTKCTISGKRNVVYK